MHAIRFLARRPGIVFSLVAVILATAAGVSTMTGAFDRDNSAALASAAEGGGVATTLKYVKKTVNVPKGQFRVVTARCPAGHTTIAGGFASSHGNVLGVANYPLGSRKGWVAGTSNVFPQVRIATRLTGYAICAKSGTRLFAAPAGAGIAEVE